MSTFTAVGPALSLDGPLPVAPEHSLLNTRLRTPDGDLESVVRDRDATRVLNGVNVWGYPEGCSYLWEPCSDGTFRLKNATSEESIPRFDSYAVYKGVSCSSITVADRDVFNRRLDAVLDATMSAGIERALIEGVDGSNNPFIGDGNFDDLTPSPGTAVSPQVGLSILENAIGTTCRAGMIGVTPATAVALQTFPLDALAERRLVTVNGTPLYSADGLIGVDTDTMGEAGDGEDWMVAHGPVHIYLGPRVTQDVRSSLDRSDNTLEFRAENYVLHVWDTALQAGVLVDWAS